MTLRRASASAMPCIVRMLSTNDSSNGPAKIVADDGLLPKFVSRIHPKFRTPYITTIATGIVVACFAAVFTVREAGSLVSIGTLLAFVIVSIGVLVLRPREPELPRTFKTPAVWFVAPMGALSALALMISLPWLTWERLIYWFAFGIVIYFGYSVYNSKLGPRKIAGETHARHLMMELPSGADKKENTKNRLTS